MRNSSVPLLQPNTFAEIQQAQSAVWIMFDQVATEAVGFNHIPGGSNVLYLDGHMDYVRYIAEIPYGSGGSTAPVNEGVARFIRLIYTEFD